jgi:hypothetical protein
MLFDLRGRGRRRTVQAVYAGLALLIGAGLVFFGVGAGVGGSGILSSLTGSEGSGGASYAAQIEKYEKIVRKHPQNAHAWEQLTLAQLHEAGNEAYETRTGVTSKGRELYTQIAHSWNSYLALHPSHPNARIAQEMVRVFGAEGLNQPAETVKALQIVIPAKSESTPQYQASLYGLLAEAAYKSHNPRIGDLAAEKAVALAPASERKRLKTLLAQVKAHPSGPEYTATYKGHKVKVKPTGNGTYSGTVTQTTPSVLGNSSKTKTK